LGLELRDLCFVNFVNFKKLDFEVQNLQKDLQQLRWKEYDKNRQNMIRDAKEVTKSIKNKFKERNRIVSEVKTQESQIKVFYYLVNFYKEHQ